MDAMYTTNLYFEAHVTVEPVFDGRLEQLRELGKAYRFNVADLLMRKRLADTPERSQFDTFLTGRGPNYGDLLNRTLDVVEACRRQGYQVWRYKIENTLIDVRLEH